MSAVFLREFDPALHPLVQWRSTNAQASAIDQGVNAQYQAIVIGIISTRTD